MITQRLILSRFLNFKLIKIQVSFIQKLRTSVSLTQQGIHKNIYLIDETKTSNRSDYKRKGCNKFTDRTYNCGQLRLENVGEHITLCGWLEFQRLNKFVVMRDGYGRTQLLISEQDSETQKLLSSLPYESIVKIKGTVSARPKDMINKKQTTGEIEVLVESFKVLNKAKDSLPFNLREFQKAKEPMRMQYRYLDLRFSEMQRNLRVRSEMLMAMRNYLVKNCGFVDVETPTLFKATPGGAQEFIVPTRFPGQFYSLVQSPQQFKQMLMAGAIDRYFQIARCYRDEGCRSDRQPEFTQLDIEMSFTNIDGVIGLIEELLQYSWPDFMEPLPHTFPRISYKNAMEKYGTDKPDTRFDFLIENCTEIFQQNENLITKNFGAHCLVFMEPFATLPKSTKQKLMRVAEKYTSTKFVSDRIGNVEEWIGKISRLLGESVAGELQKKFAIQDGTILFLAYGNKKEVLELLGLIRLEYVNILEEQGNRIKKVGMHPLWVTHFPLFEEGDTLGSLKSAHHPFTAPLAEDVHLLNDSPLEVRGEAYDLVLNGNEVAGGSIRIHNADQQELIFKMLNIERSSMQHMLDMLRSGCPPHGGIAIGLDRLLSIILHTTSIRDVIAFPKNFEGRDPLSGAPSPISEYDKQLYHLETVKS